MKYIHREVYKEIIISCNYRKINYEKKFKKTSKNRTSHVLQKMYIGLLSTPIVRLRPVCSQGLAKKAFFGAKLLWPRISRRIALCQSSPANLPAVQKPTFSRDGSCLLPTESHKFTIFATHWQIFHIKFFIYDSDHDLHPQKVHKSLVQERFGFIPQLNICLSDCTVGQKSCQITWHSSPWLSED